MLRISMTTSKGFDIGGGIVCTLRIRKVRQSRSSDPRKTSRWNLYYEDTIGRKRSCVLCRKDVLFLCKPIFNLSLKIILCREVYYIASLLRRVHCCSAYLVEAAAWRKRTADVVLASSHPVTPLCPALFRGIHCDFAHHCKQ